MKRFRFRIDPSAAAALLWLIFVDRSRYAVLSFAAAMVHEMGHLAAARLLDIKMRKMHIGSMGARLFLDSGLLSYRDEALIAAAGPAANLLCLLAVLPILSQRPSADGLLFFAAASLCLAAINLLPLCGFDGGRIICALLSSWLGESAAERILRPVYAIFTVLVWCAASSLCLVSGGNLSLLVLCVFLLFRVVSENICEQKRRGYKRI